MSEENSDDLELEVTKDIKEKMEYIQKVCQETVGGSCFLVGVMPTKSEDMSQNIGATLIQPSSQSVNLVAHSFLEKIFDKRKNEEELEPHEASVLEAILPAMLFERISDMVDNSEESED